MLKSTKKLYLVWNLLSTADKLLEEVMAFEDEETNEPDAIINADSAVSTICQLEETTRLLVDEAQLEVNDDPYGRLSQKDFLEAITKAIEAIDPCR